MRVYDHVNKPPENSEHVTPVVFKLHSLSVKIKVQLMRFQLSFIHRSPRTDLLSGIPHPEHATKLERSSCDVPENSSVVLWVFIMFSVLLRFVPVFKVVCH